jgi:hypothetical protein
MISTYFRNTAPAIFLSAALAVTTTIPSRAAITIGHVEPNTTVGEFLTSTGLTLSTGGLTVGYFSQAAPTTTQWLTLDSEPIATAYSSLTSPTGSFRFVDIRNIAGATQSGLNWSFASGAINGTVQNISTSILPAGTEMYIMAFDNGTLANSFSGAATWGVATSAASSWITPADGFGISLTLNQVSSSGVLAGTQNGDNIDLLSPTPEPSTWLSVLGGAAVLANLRRRRGPGRVF